MTQLISQEICICTRGRGINLLELLDSLSASTSIQKRLIRIIFNGEPPAEDLLNAVESVKIANNLNLEVDYSEAGLTKARNKALSSCTSDLITFIDDDIKVAPNCFEEIESLFLSNTKIIGSTPIIDGLYSDLKKSIFGRMILKRIRRKFQGKMTKSGKNFWFIDGSHKLDSYEAMWLPGCCMTYRRLMLKQLKFAEELQNGPTGGYSLGEDIIFSMRAREYGELRLNGMTRIYHQKAQSIRDNNSIMAVALGNFLAYQVKDKSSRVQISYVTIRLSLELFTLLLKNIIKPLRSIDELKRKTLEMRSFFQELKSPSLISGGRKNER